MKYLYKLLQQQSILVSILFATLFLQNCKGDNEKIKEEPKENINVQIEPEDQTHKGDCEENKITLTIEETTDLEKLPNTILQQSFSQEKWNSYLQKFEEGEFYILDEESGLHMLNPSLDPKILQSAAERGNCKAQFILGMICLQQSNLQEGTEWLQKAALNGCRDAIDMVVINAVSSIKDISLAGTDNKKILEVSTILTKLYKTGIMIPFPYLYPSRNTVVLNVKYFQDYCDKLFRLVDSYERYEQVRLNKYVRELIDWITVKEELLITHQATSLDKNSIYLNTVASILTEHIEAVLKADYLNNFPEATKLDLLNKFYEVNYKIANTCLFGIVELPNEKFAGMLLEKYNKSRKALNNRFGLSRSKNLSNVEYIKMLDDAYNTMSSLLPDFIASRFKAKQPQVDVNSHLTDHQVRYKNLEQHKKRREYLRQLNEKCPETDPKMKFVSKMNDLEEEFDKIKWELFILPVETIKEYKKKFLELEQFAFSVFSIKNQPIDNLDKLSVSDYIAFYESILEYYASEGKTIWACSCCNNHDEHDDVFWFVQGLIVLLNLDDNISQVLIRLEAIDNFYSKLSRHPEYFEYFVALQYAKCGQYDKLSKLYEEVIAEKLAHQNSLKKQHQNKIKLIKEAQLAQMALAAAKSNPVKSTTLDRVQRVDVRHTPIESDLLSEVACEANRLHQQEEAEARMRRHQQAEEERSKRKLLVDELSQENEKEVSTLISLDERKEKEDKGKEKEEPSTSQVKEIETEVSSVHFPLSPKVYATVNKIFDNNWKINRKDIEHLFKELGNTINISTKSSHHIIQIPCGITLVNENGKITHMITGLSAQVGGHLSLPSWEGLVPVYMRSQITNLLSAIGLHAENYSKSNSREHVQLVSVDSSSPDNPSTTSTTKTNKKRNKRKKKKINY